MEVTQFLVYSLAHRCSHKKVLVIGTKAYFIAWESVVKPSFVQDWSVKHSNIPNFKRAIGISCCQSGAIRERNNGSKIFSDVMRLPDQHFRPVQILFGAKNLKRAVHAATK